MTSLGRNPRRMSARIATLIKMVQIRPSSFRKIHQNLIRPSSGDGVSASVLCGDGASTWDVAQNRAGALVISQLMALRPTVVS